MTTDQLSLEEVQRVTDDLSRLWLRLHRIERDLGLSEAAEDEEGERDDGAEQLAGRAPAVI